MTREEFFFKYGCDCKDPNCSSVVKGKCSAEFYSDLDSVIQKEKFEEYQRGYEDGKRYMAYEGDETELQQDNNT